MSKVDQKQAVRNVAYCADATWTCALCPYQKANMDLYLTIVNINSRTLKWSPRTVRDSIPRSKLAHYANYEYNEARELSYTPMVLKYERLFHTFTENDVREPWMLEEIDDLLIGFLSSGDEDSSSDTLSCSNKDTNFESPFLNAATFDEMALKLRITSKNIKKIWDTQYFPYFGWRPESQTSSLVLFKSPTSQMFTTVKPEGCATSEWFQSSEEGLTQIKLLSKTMKQQNTWIFKKQAAPLTWQDTPSASSHKRLYSAVLQGDAPPDQPAKPEPALLRLPCPYYVTSRQPTPLTTGVYATPPFHHQYIPLYPPSNFIPTTSLLNFRQTNYFPLMLQNATPPYVNYTSYRTVLLPPRPQMVVPSGGWFLPTPQVKVNLLTAPPLVHFRPPKPTLADQAVANQELETIAVKTVNAVLEEPEPYVPVTGVSSDELELQALEQYNSSTSVFQELEREAAEQYDVSENWTGPPKHLDDSTATFFGGCCTAKLGAQIMV